MKKHRPSRISQPGEPFRRHTHTDYHAAPEVRDEESLFSIVAAQKAPLLLILDGVTDPHNLGACLRTAEASGVHAVVTPKDRSATITDTVRHIACGAAERVPFVQVTNLARTMEKLKEAGVWIAGSADQSQTLIYEIDLTGPMAIVMGAEGPGMRRLTAEKCDFLMRIPMQGKVECLNVSVAAGICLFEAVRQRLVSAGGVSRDRPRGS
jgi:23S rRNA (guanosine2251-2'-O)-methyltransferase